MKIKKGDRIAYAKKVARRRATPTKRKKQLAQGVTLVIPVGGTHPGAVFKKKV